MKLRQAINLSASTHRSPKLTVMVGLPGSGKSTKAMKLAASNPNAMLLSRDILRGQTGIGSESTLTQHMWHMASEALSAGRDVIVDSPNMDKNDKPAWTKIAAEHKASLHFMHMNTPYGIAINRDAKRSNPVGKARIKDMERGI